MQMGSGYNCIFVGSKGYMGTSGRGEGVGLLPGDRWADYTLPPQFLPRSPGHLRDWIRACKGGSPACSNFNVAAPYAEWLVLGSAAARVEGKRGVDVVFEHVGKKTWERSIRSVAAGGRVVTCGATTGYDPPTDLRHVFFRQISILGSTMGTAADLMQVLRFVGEGKLRPVVDRTLPLAEARAAQGLLADRAQFGKIVLVT